MWVFQRYFKFFFRWGFKQGFMWDWCVGIHAGFAQDSGGIHAGFVWIFFMRELKRKSMRDSCGNPCGIHSEIRAGFRVETCYLGSSWSHLGIIWTHFVAILGHWGHLVASGALLGHFGAILGHVGVILGHVRAILGPCWGMLESCWAISGPCQKTELFRYARPGHHCWLASSWPI